MANDLMNSGGNLPAHIRKFFGDGPPANTDLTSGVSVGYPIISYKGKTWTVVENGDRVLVTRGGEGRDAEEPAASISAVIVRANPHLNKVYYPDGYEEGSTEKPLCHSNDSIAPALDAQQPQAKKCAVCPHNQWGSKITENGARGKACSDSRRLAVAPEGDLERVMLLRVPAASLKTLLAYAQNLDKRGVPYQALVTRIGFDHTVAYPSLTFSPERWLDGDELAQVMELQESDQVLAITALNAPSIADTPPEEADDGFQLPPGGPPAAAASAPKAAPKANRRQATADEVEKALGVTGQTTAGPAQQTPPAEAPKKKGTGFGTRKTTASATEAAPAAAEPAEQNGATELAEGVMGELDAILGQFDDQ